jgi:hypothetical protein
MEELFRTPLSESKPLEPQVNRLVRVARTLNTLGFDLEDKALAYIIVLKLPDSMTTLKTTLFDIGASDISTEAVVSQIVLDEQRRVRASSVGTAAYFARAAENGQSASNGREKKCTYCNKRGHNVSECRKVRREQESRGVRNSSVSSAAAPPAPANIGHAASPSGDNTSLAADAELTIGVAIVSSDTEDLPSTVTSSESTAGPELKNQWMMGTAATHTMCPNRSWFSDFSPLASPVQVALGGPRTHRATGTGTGTVPVRMWANLQWHHEVLEDVLFVPDLRRNVLSVPQLVDRGASVQFQENMCQLYDRHGQLTCEGRSQGGLYLMDIQPTSPEACSVPESNASPPGGDEF